MTKVQYTNQLLEEADKKKLPVLDVAVEKIMELKKKLKECYDDNPHNDHCMFHRSD